MCVTKGKGRRCLSLSLRLIRIWPNFGTVRSFYQPAEHSAAIRMNEYGPQSFHASIVLHYIACLRVCLVSPLIRIQPQYLAYCPFFNPFCIAYVHRVFSDDQFLDTIRYTTPRSSIINNQLHSSTHTIPAT